MSIRLSENNRDYSFQVQMPVRISDIVGGIHVANHMLIAYITEAHMQFLAMLGFPKLQIDSAIPINKDLEISYRSEASYGDTINIALLIDSIEQTAYQAIFHVSCKKTERIICQARMTMVFVNIHKQQGKQQGKQQIKQRRTHVPEDFIKACRSFQDNKHV